MALQVRRAGGLVASPTAMQAAEQRYHLALETIHQQQVVIKQLEDAILRDVRCERLKRDACVHTMASAESEGRGGDGDPDGTGAVEPRHERLGVCRNDPPAGGAAHGAAASAYLKLMWRTSS